MSEVVSSSNEHHEKDTLRAVFKVLAGETTGTGFLVKDQQHVLTARHVVEDVLNQKERLVTVIIDGEECQGRIVKDLPEWDVALLQLNVPVKDIQYLNPVPDKLVPGTKFRSYGFPQSYSPGWYNGEFEGLSKSYRTYDIKFDLSFQPQLEGLSGGPVFAQDNENAVVAFVCEHGPHPQKGKVVSVESFYNKIFLESQEPSEKLWCYVILSETDKIKHQIKQYTLRSVVKRAVNLLENDPDIHKYIENAEDIKNPEFDYATALVSDLGKYTDAIRKLCQAKIAIFDVTHYEPAVMLLLGIRSVVRRGVTIVSYGEDFMIGDPINLPFNITDINIVSHSVKQQQKGDQTYVKEITPPYIIHDKIKDGLRHLDSLPQYLDLPTFDAIRNLPLEYREPITNDILVLCSYGEVYQETNWGILWAGLKEQLDKKTGGGPASRVIRILDLKSPRLVSHTIYEAIRRVVLCITDWTEWRPNVFFELGVRLAVTNDTGYTVCIIDKTHVERVKEINQTLAENKITPDEVDEMICKLAGIDRNLNTRDSTFKSIKERYLRISAQCEHLLKLFNPHEYRCIPPEDDDQSQYEAMMYHFVGTKKVASKGSIGRASSDTYDTIEKNINTNGEITSTPVYRELWRTARLFAVDDSNARATVLYSNNENLKNNVDFGVTQRLLAAWYFIRNEYSNKDIIADPKLLEVCKDIGLNLPRRLLESKPLLAEVIRSTTRFWSYLEIWYPIRSKYTDQEIIKDPKLLSTCQDLESKLTRLQQDLISKLAKSPNDSKPSDSKPKLTEEIDSSIQSLRSLLGEMEEQP